MNCKVYILDKKTGKTKLPIQRGSEDGKLFWVLNNKVNAMPLIQRRSVIIKFWIKILPEPNHFRRYATKSKDVFSAISHYSFITTDM